MDEQQNRSNSFKTVSGTLASAVADSGTFTTSYPARSAPETGSTNAGDFYNAFYHRLVMSQATLVYPKDFDISFGASTITITNKTGSTWPAGTNFVAQYDEPGKKVWGPGAGGQIMAREARADTILVSLGTPAAIVTNGVCASQSIAAGTASTTTSATLNGSLASGGMVIFDVSRAVQAAWTTTAVLTIVGYDEYGNFMVEKSASGASHTGVKAFKRITRVWSSVAITSCTVGSADVLGLPFFLPARSVVRAELVNGLLAGDGTHIYLPLQMTSADLITNHADQQVVSPVAGRIVRFSSIVQAALGNSLDDIGTVNLKVGGTAVSESTLTSFSTAGTALGAVGSVASVQITTGSTNAAVTAGQNIAISPTSTWASAGQLNFVVEIAPTGGSIYKSGTFVAGNTTAGALSATSADVRGTYTPPVATDGSTVFQLLVSLPDTGNRGGTQFTE